MESGDIEDIITTIDTEEVFYYDLLTGFDSLPPRQQQAFDLICLQGYTESAATKIMLPDSKMEYSCPAVRRHGLVAHGRRIRPEAGWHLGPQGSQTQTKA